MYFTWSEVKITGDIKIQKWLGTFIAAPTVFVYLIFKIIFNKLVINKSISDTLCKIGGATFGIYLLEERLRELFLYKFIEQLRPVIKTMPSCLIGISITIIIGTAIVLLLKKVPLFKRVL